MAPHHHGSSTTPCIGCGIAPFQRNAYWNGTTLNFFRAGGGCDNTGELPGVSLHEFGHGLDSNDGNGGSPEAGTGETYGDFTAVLATHSSCIGNGFIQGTNCGGYGNACTSCSGVRDIDWAKHTDNTPHTPFNFTRTNCPFRPGYVGPCGREGHCESQIASEALWDLANRDLPEPGSGAAWATTDRLWYLSRSTATSAFTCSVPSFTSSGCGVARQARAKAVAVPAATGRRRAARADPGPPIASSRARHG